MKKPADMNVRVFNFFDVADYIAEQENYSKGWSDELLYQFCVSNDSAIYVEVTSDPDLNTDIKRDFYYGLIKYFDVKEDESVMLWFSW